VFCSLGLKAYYDEKGEESTRRANQLTHFSWFPLRLCGAVFLVLPNQNNCTGTAGVVEVEVVQLHLSNFHPSACLCRSYRSSLQAQRKRGDVCGRRPAAALELGSHACKLRVNYGSYSKKGYSKRCGVQTHNGCKVPTARSLGSRSAEI
jgi:hypothetical protein